MFGELRNRNFVYCMLFKDSYNCFYARAFIRIFYMYL